MNDDDRHLARGEALLDLRRQEDLVVAAEPLPAPRELGARSGFGRVGSATSARASVFLFDEYAGAVAAEVELRRRPAPGLTVASTVNGPLLLWATAEATDPAGTELVEQWISSFAGEE